jgi:hypothetical protein
MKPEEIKEFVTKIANRNLKSINGGKIKKEMFEEIWKQTGFNIYVFAHTLFNAGRRFEKNLKKENEKTIN